MHFSTKLAIVIGLTLAGCQAQPDQAGIRIDPNQVYQGYPCYDNCEAFKQGFNSAKAQTKTQVSQCTATNQPEKLGCLAFVHEYKAEHESDLKL